MIESQLDIPSGNTLLSATLTLPESDLESSPIVVMIHGSGPLDRNENFRVQQLNTFNAFAHYFAKQGIASLRFDKRGCGNSTGHYLSAGHQDLVDDVLNIVNYLLSHPDHRFQALYLLGHSEGCIIGPQVALKQPKVAGLIQLCPFIENLETTLTRQGKQLEKEIATMRGVGGALARGIIKLFGSPLKMQSRLIKKLKASTKDVVWVMGKKHNAKWFRELFEIEPEEVFAEIKIPMLLIGGGKDVQCRAADVARIAEAAKGRCEQVIIPDLTHILRCDEEAASLSHYQKLLKQPIEPELLERTSRWLLQQLG